MGKNIDHDILELRGSSISYFTGKMENYFRLKGIPYRLESMVFPGESERNKEGSRPVSNANGPAA
jgi:hypothetical protein